jgi:CelD/BcsL family acetyltransferase involved in cellulose biosynthesis
MEHADATSAARDKGSENGWSEQVTPGNLWYRIVNHAAPHADTTRECSLAETGNPMLDSSELKLLRGAEADALLADHSFREQWQRALMDCPWATAYQGHAFVGAWYRIYRALFEPLLVLGLDREGQIRGLLPLAVSVKNAAIVPAGDIQAEYQGWICAPSLADSFPLGAFAALRRQFPSRPLNFRYLPPRIPIDWTENAEVDDLCVLRSRRRPLLRFGDGQGITSSLHKSGNKSRLRQLKKIGAIEFKRVDDPAAFDALLTEMVGHYDRRHSKIQSFAPFQRDGLKRDFTRALMNEPGLFHISTFSVGGQLASAHLNLVKGKEVQLGLIAHNSAFEHFSPGKLHILFLARMLLEEGFEQLDLTPGGEAYKERFANGGDEVHELTLFPTPTRRALGVARLAIEDGAKRTVQALHLNPASLRSLARRANASAPVRAAASLLRSIGSPLLWGRKSLDL